MKIDVYLNNLYDLYKNLLTEKEISNFEDYYFNDLSLQEIALNNKISRNAIFKRLKTISDKLKDYETKLELYKKKNKINSLIKDDKLKEQINEIL